MGLDCILEDEFGEELDEVEDAAGELARSAPVGDAGFPLLCHLDLEGTTTFNRLQLAAAAPELERLSREASEPARPLWTKVRALARRAAAEPHLHLRFLGD